MTQAFYGGIDAGGTEFKCIVASSPENILGEIKVPVGGPEDTLSECAAFFKQMQAQYGVLSSLGIGCFGPLDLDTASDQYGRIRATPKPHWSGTDVLGYFTAALECPVHIDTDVNAALLGELTWGAARSLHSAVYVTVGTGIGAGIYSNGRILHGAMHAESGHMLIPRHQDDGFHGICPFHSGCLEGLASGAALAERWQMNPKKIPVNHSAWSLEAHYLGVMCVNLALMYSPQKMILGGGVMQQEHLLPAIRNAYLSLINGYLGEQSASMETFIVGAELGAKAGALGAIALAQCAS